MNESAKNKIDDNKIRCDPADEQTIHQPDDQAKNSGDSNWQKDIENHDYYYDDSHGYEIYDADEDDENDED
jgi:hypothetical protein